MPVPPVLQILGLLAAVVLLGAGLWVLRVGRTGEDDPAGMSRPTRLVVGMSLLILGYHLIAYLAPGGVQLVHVPAHRAWIMGVGMAVAVGSSFYMDRRQRTHG